ncbi:glycosyltransferase family 2 protein [Bifidobacterium callimiconis]|uniref:glycosyltransferase n=1 Tax=Bifidobacterium callimiconis TaxID=2306973 RepID=UPI001BDC43CA|nr:glycosyltransferase family 2 protein [Bifidobacterium callimiconis]
MKQADRTPKVSIIVPVYNSEQYLNECVQSLLEQTYKNFEIILVNDGSTDNSGELCELWARQDKRIHAIHQNNHGVSTSRNTAIKQSTGDYILCVDSDDWVDESLLQTCMNAMLSTSSQAAIFDYQRTREDHTPIIEDEAIHWLPQEDSISGDEATRLILQGKVPCLACRYIAARYLYTDHGIFFPVGRVMEDMGTVYKIWFHATSIALVRKPLYFYRQNESSLTAGGHRLDHVTSNIENLNEIRSFISEHGQHLSKDAARFALTMTFNSMKTLRILRASMTSSQYREIRRLIMKQSRSAFFELGLRGNDVRSIARFVATRII